MSETKPIYGGEALLRNWSESAGGKRRIILEIEDNGGAHPFKGYEGERFAVVIVGPLAPDEHVEPVARKGKAGGVPTRKDGRAEADMSAEVIASAPRTNSKRRWQDMPASQRAALRVKDRNFWNYIGEAHGVVCQDEHMADAWLKDRLDVDSKSKITGPVAHHFDLIDGKFHAWSQARGHGVI